MTILYLIRFRKNTVSEIILCFLFFDNKLIKVILYKADTSSKLQSSKVYDLKERESLNLKKYHS